MDTKTEFSNERRYPRMRVCTNLRAGDILPSCGARGSKELARALREELTRRGEFIRMETVHCMGRCHIGPTIKLLPGGPFLQGATADRAGRLMDLLEAEAYDEAAAEFPDPALQSEE